MKQTPYSYKRKGFDRYVFSSVGRSTIVKLVDLSPTRTKNLFSLGFGDLLPDGSLDDQVNSNNGDIIKVLATVSQIVVDFTAQFPEIKIGFTGSTEDRTKLYGRILKTYFDEISKDFSITALILSGDTIEEVEFLPQSTYQYFAFFVKRII